MPDRRTLPLPTREHTRRLRSAFDVILTVPCPFCGRKVGAELRCEHVVDFLLPAENGGQYGVVVESAEVPSV